MFERHDWTQFRQLSTLAQKGGVASEDLVSLVAKELADNALDVSGLDGFGVGLIPGENGFYVEDGGSGFNGDDDRIASMFSVNRPLTSTKLIRMPTRGAMGNGLRIVAGAVLATGGSLIVTTKGRTIRLVPQDDTGLTKPERIGESDRTGTRVEVRLGHSLRVFPGSLEWARLAAKLAYGESSYRGKTSPHWYDSDSFFELLNSAVGQTVVDVIGGFDGCAHPKSGVIAREFVGRLASSMGRDEADRLLTRAKEEAREVNPARLGCIGKAAIGLSTHHAKLTGTFSSSPGKGPLVASIPFVMEAWAEVSQVASVRVSVNRTPVPFNFRARFYSKEKSIDIFGCTLQHSFEVGRKPMRLHLNIDTPAMPLANDGKTPDLISFRSQIEEILKTASRKAKTASSRGFPDTSKSKKDVILACLDVAIAKAGESGKYRFSLRQLFYAVRPYVIESNDEEPEYNYFCQVITDYEAENGIIPKMYRDPRGTLYHPHTKKEIPLGTIEVEKYERPAFTFNKILYCEKEGLFPVLKDSGWPERNDCALMSAKGFASRAAREVIDMLGRTGENEDIWFFCIHDADAYGTSIYEALQDATAAMPARKVHIENLGLEPKEALEMKLQVEDVKRKGDREAPVASYVEPEWAEWLQSHRVELNAMSTGQFLTWLDEKFAKYAGKVIPPADVMEDQLRAELKGQIRRQIRRRVLRDARVDELVDAGLASVESIVEAQAAKLVRRVRRELEWNDVNLWTAPVAKVAASIARKADASRSEIVEPE